ncbi:MAG: peptidase C14 caspase catalytic subunit p20 [Bacteroidetes bacterium]|nr:peptidase C14 caspase catalytic subunit p20 [Bacteroidota bacterium]
MAASLLLLLSVSLQANCKKGNCLNGYGTYVYGNGAEYIGNFKDGNPHGKGILYFANGNKYIGHWESSQRHGKGRMVFSEGHEYLGQFLFNKMNGHGVMTYANGDIYDGNWKNDRPNGVGKYKFSNGERYEGDFVDGRFHGHGIMYYIDGGRYDGQWANNKKHGAGVLFASDGKTWEGEWANGNRQGGDFEEPMFTASSSGSGTDRDCNTVFCANGSGFYTYLDGSRYEGEFYKGEPDGKGIVYYANGDRYEGGWKHHGPHGEGMMYYANGRVLGAVWEYGKLIKTLEAPDDTRPDTRIAVDESKAVKIWAVVIGVGEYGHMPQLKYTDDDAYKIYAFLKSPQGGALPDEQIRVLVDGNATRANIVDAMEQTFMRADANDVVIFYFSGHGLEGSFLPVDYDGYNNLLKHDEITRLLEKSQAKHKIVLADACHSGSLLAMKAPNRPMLQRYYSAFEDSDGGMALLMSSRGSEFSLEDGGLRSGVFSYFLVEGLKGGADVDQDGIVVIQEIYDYVNQHVVSYTARAQTPTLMGDFDPGMPVSILRN